MSYDIARQYHAAGLTVIPILADGSKRPAVKWGVYRQQRPTDTELRQWFSHCDGLAVLGGAASGGLEILDFDDPTTLAPWAEQVKAKLPDLLATLPVARTPSGGTHVFYRCVEVGGNMKLAQGLDPATGEILTRIETRGEGGYAVIPPTPARYHPDNRPYRLLRGDLCAVPTITPAERSVLLDTACLFNTYQPPEVQRPPRTRNPLTYSDRPGDAYNANTSWDDLLTRHGWKLLRTHGNICYWQRPGKTGEGCSATTGHGDYDTLYIFSSNAYPFEPGRGYTKFTALALLEHGGDVSAAARSLTQQRREASVYIPARAQAILAAAYAGG